MIASFPRWFNGISVTFFIPVRFAIYTAQGYSPLAVAEQISFAHRHPIVIREIPAITSSVVIYASKQVARVEHKFIFIQTKQSAWTYCNFACTCTRLRKTIDSHLTSRKEAERRLKSPATSRSANFITSKRTTLRAS